MSDGGQMQWFANGGVEGAAHVELKGTATSSLFQTVRNELPGRYKVRANYKNPDVNSNAKVTLVLEAREVIFTGTDKCEYPGGFSYVGPKAIGGFKQRARQTFTVPHNWTYNTSFPGWVAPAADAYDVRVRVYKNGAPVRLDYVRAHNY